jgi:dTDP-4-dehydrorhamnose 3,5-epimerase
MYIEKFGDAFVLNNKKYFDNRGYFIETWHHHNFTKLGFDVSWVQDNLSFSKGAYTLRGLHMQTSPHQQAKFVTCLKGRILDVIVDARSDSSSYGSSWMIELSAVNAKQLYVPEGFLHGFLTLENDCLVTYKCSAHYSPDNEVTVSFKDTDLGINWPVSHGRMIVSEKDKAGIAFSALSDWI